MKYILVRGTPKDGFNYYGPFETAEIALSYAEYETGLNVDWWIEPLHSVSGKDSADNPPVNRPPYDQEIDTVLDEITTDWSDGSE